MKAIGIIMRVLAACIMIVFVVAGIFAGKFATWMGGASALSSIMDMSVNWFIAAIVWIVGLAIALATYGQGMILSALANKEE